MKQKFNVTGMIPHGMEHPVGAPVLSICSGGVNPPGIKVLPAAKRLNRATRRGQVMPEVALL